MTTTTTTTTGGHALDQLESALARYSASDKSDPALVLVADKCRFAVQDVYGYTLTLGALAGVAYAPGDVAASQDAAFLDDAVKGYYSRPELAKMLRAWGARGRSYSDLVHNALARCRAVGAAGGFDPYTSMPIESGPTPEPDETDLNNRSEAYHDHPSHPSSCEAHWEHYERSCPCEDYTHEPEPAPGVVVKAEALGA